MLMTMNKRLLEVSSDTDLKDLLLRDEDYVEAWLNSSGFPTLCALMNRTSGWLMLLRSEEDCGLVSTNPAFEGSVADTQLYRLSNGQMDEYPASWALPHADVLQAMHYFIQHKALPPSVVWQTGGS